MLLLMFGGAQSTRLLNFCLWYQYSRFQGKEKENVRNRIDKTWGRCIYLI